MIHLNRQKTETKEEEEKGGKKNWEKCAKAHEYFIHMIHMFYFYNS